jgi:hypothetical protein
MEIISYTITGMYLNSKHYQFLELYKRVKQNH